MVNGKDKPARSLLYVDDDVLACRIFAHQMGKRGFDVDIATSPTGALHLATERAEQGAPYDVVVSDLVMPQLDGFELIGQLRSLAPQTVFLIVTGLPQDQFADELAASQADATVVCKPWRADDLSRVIETALARVQAGQHQSRAAGGIVLVVDGDLGDAVLTRCTLESLGIAPERVRYAANAQQALAVVQDGADAVDMIVSEVDSQGVDVLDELRAAAPDAALVALTDSAEDIGVEADVVARGAHSVLRKTPLSQEALGRSIVGALARRDLQTQRAAEARGDALTGLPGREQLQWQTRHAVRRARRTGYRVGVLVCDINNLSFARCMRGDHAADQLVVQVAEQLCMTVREEDPVAHVAAGRFVVLLELLDDMGGAVACAERIKTALDVGLTVGGEPIDLPLDIRGACYPEDGDSLDALMEAALGRPDITEVAPPGVDAAPAQRRRAGGAYWAD